MQNTNLDNIFIFTKGCLATERRNRYFLQYIASQSFDLLRSKFCLNNSLLVGSYPIDVFKGF
jgi:hypothetical protein